MKNVQISLNLFFMLVKYHLGGEEVWQKEIEVELNKKIDAILARDKYTKYKTAITKEEQEKARNEYLNLKGYHPDWRW